MLICHVAAAESVGVAETDEGYSASALVLPQRHGFSTPVRDMNGERAAYSAVARRFTGMPVFGEPSVGAAARAPSPRVQYC